VNANGANGLLYGDSGFFIKQILAVVISSIYAFAFTWVMLWIIDRITPVKLTSAEEEIGLDEILHGEHAYTDAM
ncbi:MAG: ammonium transporter, partial [Ignavibacteria bacterium]